VTAGTKENRAVDSHEKIDTIRFGLKAIKNVGEHIVEELIKERKANGPYNDIFDLLERITDKDLNKKSLESLIKSGSFDSQGERGQLLSNMERLLSFNKESVKSKNNGQNSLFADLPSAGLNHLTLNSAPPAAADEKLIWEKELLGLYVSEHPYNVFRPHLVNYAVPLAELKSHQSDNRLVVAGIISTIKKIITRNNESMLFVKIEDATNTAELLIFPRLLKETAALWQGGQAVIIDGKVSEKDKEMKVLVNRAAALSSAEPQKSINDFKKIVLEGGPIKTGYRNGQGNGYNNGYGNGNGYNNSGAYNKKPVAPKTPAPVVANPLRIIFLKNLSPFDTEDLRKIFSLYPGEDNVYFKITAGGKANIIKTAFRVANDEELRTKLQEKFSAAIKIAV
jgi:DNA polymerase-3 subunit alpha